MYLSIYLKVIGFISLIVSIGLSIWIYRQLKKGHFHTLIAFVAFILYNSPRFVWMAIDQITYMFNSNRYLEAVMLASSPFRVPKGRSYSDYCKKTFGNQIKMPMVGGKQFDNLNGRYCNFNYSPLYTSVYQPIIYKSLGNGKAEYWITTGTTVVGPVPTPQIGS